MVYNHKLNFNLLRVVAYINNLTPLIKKKKNVLLKNNSIKTNPYLEINFKIKQVGMIFRTEHQEHFYKGQIIRQIINHGIVTLMTNQTRLSWNKKIRI